MHEFDDHLPPGRRPRAGWSGRGGRGGRGGFAKFEEFAGPGGPGPWSHHGHGHHGGPPPWAGGRRARRGDIRWALLLGLLDGPAHGYELIGRLEARTGGMWRPSAGSVYPTLQLLEDEGLVVGRDQGGKRVFELTDPGRAAAEEASQRAGGRGPWAEGPTGHHVELRRAMKAFMMAARQVAAVGDDDQVAAAAGVVSDARQRLYRLLAGDQPAPGPAPGDPGVPRQG